MKKRLIHARSNSDDDIGAPVLPTSLFGPKKTNANASPTKIGLVFAFVSGGGEQEIRTLDTGFARILA